MTFLLILAVWLIGGILTIPALMWWFGPPNPAWRILHVFWSWPFVWFVMALDKAYRFYNGHEPPGSYKGDFSDDRHD